MDFWYLLISLRARVPGLYLNFLFSPLAAAAWEAVYLTPPLAGPVFLLVGFTLPDDFLDLESILDAVFFYLGMFALLSVEIFEFK